MKLRIFSREIGWSLIIGGVLPGFVTRIHKDSVHKWNLWFPLAGVFAEVLAGRKMGMQITLPRNRLKANNVSIAVGHISNCSYCVKWKYTPFFFICLGVISTHTYGRIKGVWFIQVIRLACPQTEIQNNNITETYRDSTTTTQQTLPWTDCRVLPHNKFNGMIPEPLAVYYERFVMTAVIAFS